MQYGFAAPYVESRLAAEMAQAAENAGWDGMFVGDAIWTTDPMISLTAAAMRTSRIKLGTMIIPVPLRKPWKIASEAAALDRLSGGRVILGLGAGAVWMGWQGFPGEVTETKARAGMLDETIDILTLLFQGKPFDYDGKHFPVKLTLVDAMHYPPPPLQQPRIPLWVVGIYPRKKSMRRLLKCDGWLPMKMGATGEYEEVTPADLREAKAYIDANRTLGTPFEYIIEGKTAGLAPGEAQEKLHTWQQAGATWWIEGMWEKTPAQVIEILRQGPPRIG